MDVYSDIEIIKGIGPKTKKILNQCGIYTIMDLLLYFPRDYEKISKNVSNNVKLGQKSIFNCTVIKIDKDIKTKTNKILTTVIFKYEDNIIKGRWFNQPYMKDKFMLLKQYTIAGKIEIFKGEKIMLNPIIVNKTYINNENKSLCKNKEEYLLIPIYSLKEGLTNKFIIKILSEVLSKIYIEENMPQWFIKKYNLMSLDKAIKNIHNPHNIEDLNEAKKRLKFQELFTYSLKILMLKDFIKRNNQGISFKISPELKILKETLPFNLTTAQNKVIREILIDQKKNKAMNRLVQGDVGSGKTIVAIITVFNVVKNGYQVAVMAPTEILANQHYEEFNNILKSFNINIKMLSGSMSEKQKLEIKQELKFGKIDILIGTHALLEEDVQFKNLGMIVTDEQHRFGVMQRNILLNKGNNVDVLVMTATPIPRTLALTLYGDLDISIINELPPGRQKIDTYYVDYKNKDKVYKFAIEEVKKGRQVYVVCPLVENNDELELNSVETLYEELTQKYFSPKEVAFLYGKMPNKLKDEIMQKFKSGNIKVLISTTVIEVGINVPNATVMIIENAERFGLAQLHQLRGRVGRGKFKSYCILIAKINNKIVEKRLNILQKSNDGFYIAEEDLKLRGSGELLGFKQHGEDNLILSDLVEDIDLFKIANIEARRLLKSNDSEDIKIKEEIIKKLDNTSKFICFN
ncbi:ATP-dependent DNA helicase RecG [Clostridium sp. USBA 49]|jgi:ATP-dependent DNA helicase RecG|uniref:ATP-dependent DNA helicase RecG n=1 Tax=Clostridium sp. USBA 49 TaxID=1881060 RepID=UPI00099A7C2D|nr:ATP-dependent DNA helicase RecG [Clostridium sp. USBA 49]SKA76264.1 ATP-dependent DNA helicase RecG [Clostridium sp. USBA 49]